MSKLLTTIELMEKLQVTRPTVLAWRKNGMPAIKIGRMVRFDEKAVNEWIAERQEKNGTP